jgi:plasmid stabilization system protein ParE
VKIRFRPAAREDILKQVRFYVETEGVPHVADRFLDGVEKSTKQLQRMPRIGAPRFFANPALEGLRT